LLQLGEELFDFIIADVFEQLRFSPINDYVWFSIFFNNKSKTWPKRAKIVPNDGIF
jgi:hypothetical protein